MLEEEATLLEGTEGSQVAGSKCKEVTAGDEEEQRPPRRLEGSNQGSTMGVPQSRWRVLTPTRGVCALGRIAWYTTQGE